MSSPLPLEGGAAYIIFVSLPTDYLYYLGEYNLLTASAATILV